MVVILDLTMPLLLTLQCIVYDHKFRVLLLIINLLLKFPVIQEFHLQSKMIFTILHSSDSHLPLP